MRAPYTTTTTTAVPNPLFRPSFSHDIPPFPPLPARRAPRKNKNLPFDPEDLTRRLRPIAAQQNQQSQQNHQNARDPLPRRFFATASQRREAAAVATAEAAVKMEEREGGFDSRRKMVGPYVPRNAAVHFQRTATAHPGIMGARDREGRVSFGSGSTEGDYGLSSNSRQHHQHGHSHEYDNDHGEMVYNMGQESEERDSLGSLGGGRQDWSQGDEEKKHGLRARSSIMGLRRKLSLRSSEEGGRGLGLFWRHKK